MIDAPSVPAAPSTGNESVERQRHDHPNPERKRRAVRSRAAYVMLETVIATGMLIVGLAVIGAQLQ